MKKITLKCFAIKFLRTYSCNFILSAKSEQIAQFASIALGGTIAFHTKKNRRDDERNILG